MSDNHPITVPTGSITCWRRLYRSLSPAEKSEVSETEYIATQAARWGSDQELLACGNYLKHCAAWEEEDITEMFNYRRPRPLSLRELALASVKRFEESGEFFSDQMRELEFIRKALEQLDD